jgi:hypothetical protein
MFNLFITYYKDQNPRRQKELDFCLMHNLKNPLLNTIVFERQDRLPFSFYFGKINKISSNDDINIIANSDIYFDDTLKLAENINANNCYALSRWDDTPDGKSNFFHREDSQDVWIFKGKIKNNLFGDFLLGLCGCDNRLAFEISKAGYKISNPGLSIRAHHYHMSHIRNYIMRDKRYIVPGPYMKVEPCWLGHSARTSIC